MRTDTKEIADMLDKAADLVEQNQLEEAQNLLAKIVQLLAQWVERYLRP